MNTKLIRETDQIGDSQKDEIRRKIDERWVSAQAGLLYDGEEVFAELEAQLDEMEQGLIHGEASFANT